MTGIARKRTASNVLLTVSEAALWHAVKNIGEKALLFVGAEIEAKTGLSGPDFGVLSRLLEIGKGTLVQRELSLSLGWHKSRLSHHLTRMEARNLVRRSADSVGRSTIIDITPEGKAAILAARPVHAAAVRSHVLQYIGKDAESALKTLAASMQDGQSKS